jgi:NTP pyrophosphatase (non-canonical NTP hydrolase)
MISDFNSMDGSSDDDKVKEAITKKLLDAGFSNIEFESAISSSASNEEVHELATALMQLAEVTEELKDDLVDTVSHMIVLEKQLRAEEAQVRMMLEVITMINNEVNYLKLPWYKKLFHKKKKHDERG